jgi:excisionase family DNA binding protein
MSSDISKYSIEELSSAQLFDKLKWMTSKEAAFYLRVSVGELRNMAYRNQIVFYRLNNRLRFLRSDLDQALKPSFQTEAKA